LRTAIFRDASACLHLRDSKACFRACFLLNILSSPSPCSFANCFIPSAELRPMPLPETPSGLLSHFERRCGSREMITNVLQGVIAPFLDDLPEEYRQDITKRLSMAYDGSWWNYVAYKRHTTAIQARMERIHRHLDTRRHTEEDVRTRHPLSGCFPF
jgi:hypothetical protein